MEPARRRFSLVWEHFDQISPDKVRCLLCARELGYNNNTSSMLRHLRALHDNVEENLEDPSQVNRKRELDDALVSMIVRDKQPFSIVENKGFRDFVAKLDPTYILPTQKAVKAMMETEYQEEIEVKAEPVTMAEGHLMEVCVDSVESAVNAERGGAGRLELCSSLLEGGLTPSLGLMEVVKQRVRIPVYVMIRPRGGDFLYSHQEVEVMKKDIKVMRSQGADGLVLGALTEDGKVDAELCMDLLASARPLPVTFHRAFDMVHDPMVALETLITLGFERVLTSGCDSSALEGLPLIKKLSDQAKGRIIIMPGGGITERNLQRILEGSGAQEFHCSARSSRDSAMKFRNNCVQMGAAFSAPEYGLKVADMNKVRILNAIARNIL